MFEGDADAVDRLVTYCRNSRRSAVVERVDIHEEEPEGLSAFSVRSYSHSIVAGGFDDRSSATRFTPGISLMIRLEIVSSRS